MNHITNWHQHNQRIETVQGSGCKLSDAELVSWCWTIWGNNKKTDYCSLAFESVEMEIVAITRGLLETVDSKKVIVDQGPPLCKSYNPLYKGLVWRCMVCLWSLVRILRPGYVQLNIYSEPLYMNIHAYTRILTRCNRVTRNNNHRWAPLQRKKPIHKPNLYFRQYRMNYFNFITPKWIKRSLF